MPGNQITTMSTTNAILTALSTGLFVALVFTLYWAFGCHNKSYQRGMSYRILEERCRAIVASVNGAWPEMEEYTGQEYVEAIDAKFRQMRETERMLSSEYIGNENFLHGFDPVEVARYLMARNTELYRVDEAVTNWELRQTVQPRTITIANRVIEALAMVEAVRRVESFGLPKNKTDAAFRAMDKQFRDTMDICAKYAPGMTFADSLSMYVEACLDFTRQKAHEAGMAAAFASLK